MVNNSTNINKTKEILNSDGQQFHQYQQHEQSPLNSDGQQFHQDQQHEQSPLISYVYIYIVIINNSTNINNMNNHL